MIERTHTPEFQIKSPLTAHLVQVGLGAIGVLFVRKALETRPWLQFVGAVDPRYAGRSLAEVVEWHEPLKVGISAEPLEVRRVPLGTIAVHTATSRLAYSLQDLMHLIARGWHVVSSMEELFFPQAFHSDLAKQIDEAARAHGVTILGTGVNPGFAMDLLPITLARVCTRIDRVVCRRVVDITTRRESLQRKIGLGLSEEAFYEGIRNEMLGHVGCLESAAAIAYALGWQINHFRETIEPLVARETLQIPLLPIQPGQVMGVCHQVIGNLGEREVLRLELVMATQIEAPRDEVQIEGEPGFQTIIPGGIPGDLATVGALLNSLERIRNTSPGLRLGFEVY